MTIECNYAIEITTLSDRLKKPRSFATNAKQNQNQKRLVRALFPFFQCFEEVTCKLLIITDPHEILLFSLCIKSTIVVFKMTKQLSEENGGGPFCQQGNYHG